MSYGTAAGVGALVPRYANSSVTFDGTTRPTLTTVTALLASINSRLDIMLSSAGFTVPITDADIVPTLDFFVNEEVAAIAGGINGSGRFGPTAKKPGGSRFAIITTDIQDFINVNAAGMATMGAARSGQSVTAGMAYRDTDEAGDTIYPLFERKAFGDALFRKDWDTND